MASKYSGACEHESLLNADLAQITHPLRTTIHGPSLFALRYRVLPCILSRGALPTTETLPDEESKQYSKPGAYHATSVLRILTEEYKVDPNTILFERFGNVERKFSYMKTAYIDLGNHLAILFSSGHVSNEEIDNPYNLPADQDTTVFYCFTTATIYHVPQTAERAEQLLRRLFQYRIHWQEDVEATLSLVCKSVKLGYYATNITMKKPHITDLKLHYGDDFPSIHEELLEILQEKNSTGLTLLHGPPGTGKTNYLRYLINEIKGKKLIYVPSDMINTISDSTFLPFLLKHPNSILIVEDAENIVRDRKKDVLPQQAVSNLLNLSDGLLGDAIHQQIICTFNCEVQSIDPALLREGRLVVEYKFDRLSVENARRLCGHLAISGDLEKDIREPMSLAEIYAKKNALHDAGSTSEGESGKKPTKSKRTLRNKYQKQLSFSALYA